MEGRPLAEFKTVAALTQPTTRATESMVGGVVSSDPRMQVVVHVGACSGVLVRADTVMTSAHCVESAPTEISDGVRSFRVAKCEKHPSYKPFEAQHDIGFCTLSEPVPGNQLLADEPPTTGEAVLLAGYGQSGTFSRDAATQLRIVNASVVDVASDTFDVGSETHTACRGDSGGPVLVERNGALRVVGIIHGPTGAICASPTEATILAFDPWILGRLRNTRPNQVEHLFVLTVLLLVALVLGARHLWVRRS